MRSNNSDVGTPNRMTRQLNTFKSFLKDILINPR